MRSFSLLLAGLLLSACEKKEPAAEPGAEVPAVYRRLYGATAVYLDGEFVVVQTKDLPDHKSPYYLDPAYAGQYEAYNGTNPRWQQNPNRIREQRFTFRLPVHPAEAARKAATPLGAIGVALNGVPFYNQYAGPAQPLTTEINSFDQYNGHPQDLGEYHYHAEPLYLTATKGRNALLGFLLDGFPVYGPVEDGRAVGNADLDAYHGHRHATADYPNGTYHYHITDADPYLNGDGFFGQPGTVSQ